MPTVLAPERVAVARLAPAVPDFAVLDFATCDAARLRRDPAFDGRFFIAVRTTRVYCRPVCRVRPPRSESVDAVKRSVLGVDAPDARDPGPDGPVLGVISAHAVTEELRAGLLVEVRPAPAIPPVFLKAVLPRAVAPAPVVAAVLAALHGVDLRSTEPRPAVLNPCS